MHGRAKLVEFFGRMLFPKQWNDLESSYAVSYRDRDGKINRQLPSVLTKMLVLAEDRRFYSHSGVDALAVAAIAWRFVRTRRISGASTIEQQLVRTLTGRKERTLHRKLCEMLLAYGLSYQRDKSELAAMYLAVAYFGWRMNGVEDACRRLNIELDKITAHQAASLIARLKYPEARRPSPQRTALISNRVKYLLAVMAKSENGQTTPVISEPAFFDA